MLKRRREGRLPCQATIPRISTRLENRSGNTPTSGAGITPFARLLLLGRSPGPPRPSTANAIQGRELERARLHALPGVFLGRRSPLCQGKPHRVFGCTSPSSAPGRPARGVLPPACSRQRGVTETSPDPGTNLPSVKPTPRRAPVPTDHRKPTLGARKNGSPPEYRR